MQWRIVLLALAMSLTGPIAAPDPTLARAETPATAVWKGKTLPPADPIVTPPDAEGTIDSAGGAPSTGSAVVVSKEVSTRLARLDRNAELTVEVVGSGARQALRRFDGSLLNEIDGVALASLTAAEIQAVAADSGVSAVRLPVDLRRGLLGRGPSRTPEHRGDFWSQNHVDWLPENAGMGVNVGIIDIFDPAVLAEQIADGEIPDVPAAQRACFYLGAPCPFGVAGYTHGNEVAEVLAEGAPGANLYLAEVGTITDYLLALDWFASHGVSVVNHSATGPYDGPGDGTGPSAAVVDYAVSRGMAWFNAVGNAGKEPGQVKFTGGYFRGNWYDPTGNRWMNWYGSDESLTIYCGALMGVRWSDWGTARTDYDLYISDHRYSTKSNGTKVLVSAANQAAGAAPLEGNDMRWLCNTNPAYGPVHDLNGDGFVSLWLYRTTRSSASPSGDRIEVMVNNGYLEYPTTAGSASIPFGDSKNPGAASVGGLDNNDFTQWYSNRGPTNDGRVKPDFVWLSCISTSVRSQAWNYCGGSTFNGTSASTPVIAAYAADGIAAFDLEAPAYVISWLRSISPGANAKNNDVGWGKPVLPSQPFQPEATGYSPITPGRVLDTRGVNGQIWGAPIGLRPPGSITTIDMSTYLYAFGNDVPFDATVALNVAVVNATNDGWLQVYPTGQAAPGQTSSINVSAGQTRANFVLVQTNWGRVSFYTSGGGHIIADLVGVFGRLGPSSPKSLIPVPPYKVWDTASCLGCNGALAGGTFADVTVAGTTSPTDSSAGVPPVSGEDPPGAVALSVTVSGATQKGYLSVVRPNTTAFTTSSLNYMPGESLTTTTFMPIDELTSGKVRVFTSQTVSVRIDVLGYFASGNTDGEGLYVGRRPTRVLDTRQTGGKVDAGGFTSAQITGVGGVPVHDVAAVFVNTTSVHADAPGTVRSGATATGGGYITTSIPSPALPVAAGSIAALDADGALRVHTDTRSNLIADIGGYFTSGEGPFDGTTPILEDNGDTAWLRGLGISDDGSLVGYLRGGLVFLWHRDSGVTMQLPGSNVQDLYVAGDGQSVVFSTPSPLVPGDDTADWRHYDVYRYRVADDQYERLTTVGSSETRVRGISDDGNRVLILSPTPTGPSDTDGAADFYVHDRALLTNFALPLSPGHDLHLSGDGTRVVSGGTGGGNAVWARTWVIDTGEVTEQVVPNTLTSGYLRDVSTDGTILLYSQQNSILRFDTETGIAAILPIQYWHRGLYQPMAWLSGDGSQELMLGNRSVALGFDSESYPSALLVVHRDPFHVVTASRSTSGEVPNGFIAAAQVADGGGWAVYVTSSTNVTDTSGGNFNIYLVDLSAL
ncbi:MAG TPA: hypothetical protein DCR14_11000 [Acidimicrobiaceae bacterium]|nr:hypothetical protein [Acidimicrobiaceae bacterium]